MVPLPQRYIAFLRAINVGGHTVQMEHLRALFTALRFDNVETFIASGNVIFDSPSSDAAALEQRIEQHLEKSLGYAVGTFLRAPEELAPVYAHQPFGDPTLLSPPHSISIGFLKQAVGTAARGQVMALRTATDDFDVHGRELYWCCRTRTSDSEVSGPRLAKALGAPVTLRNATTLGKLVAKYGRQT